MGLEMDQDEQERPVLKFTAGPDHPMECDMCELWYIGKWGAVGLLPGKHLLPGPGKQEKTIAEGFWEPAVRSWGLEPHPI